MKSLAILQAQIRRVVFVEPVCDSAFAQCSTDWLTVDVSGGATNNGFYEFNGIGAL